MYGSTGGYGGFSIFWVIVVFAAPIVGAIFSGGLPDGSSSLRSIPPIFFVASGVGIAVLVGSKLLQDRVRKLEAEGPKPSKLEEFAREIRLLLEEDPATKRPKLTGKRGQVWLAVHLLKKQTRIVARHNLKLPADFSITNTGKTRSKVLSSAQGGLVLSQALQFAGAEELDIAWQHPEVAGALMAVLHPFPGSSINSKHITIEGAGMKQDEIDGHINDIVKLVAVLREPPSEDIQPPRFPGK